MSSIMDKIKEIQKQKESIRVTSDKPTSNNDESKCGYRWLTMLIKYDIEGNAEIVRSFTRPAAESYIKDKVIKKPKKEPEIKFDIKPKKTTDRDKVKLWDD